MILDFLVIATYKFVRLIIIKNGKHWLIRCILEKVCLGLRSSKLLLAAERHGV